MLLWSWLWLLYPSAEMDFSLQVTFTYNGPSLVKIYKCNMQLKVEWQSIQKSMKDKSNHFTTMRNYSWDENVRDQNNGKRTFTLHDKALFPLEKKMYQTGGLVIGSDTNDIALSSKSYSEFLLIPQQAGSCSSCFSLTHIHHWVKNHINTCPFPHLGRAEWINSFKRNHGQTSVLEIRTYIG